MTFDPKEARALVDELWHRGKMSDCWCPNRRAADTITAALDRIDALEAEIERLKNPPDEYCAKCGAPKSNHPYRHPFVTTHKGDPT